MNPKAIELQARTQRFAAAVIIFCEALPDTHATREIIPQLIDSAGSTASNYRSACRGRTPKEFIAKMGVAAEEADESKGWLELLVSSNQVSQEQAAGLIQEADELTAIFVKSQKTATKGLEERSRLARGLSRRGRER